jgi:hypothetical protein
VGKLHTLERAIRRNPSDWCLGREILPPRKNPIIMGGVRHRKTGKWRPDCSSKSYQAFVLHVLVSMGYIERIREP